MINLLDPEIIVLGGGLGQIDTLYRAVPDRWGDYVFSDKVTTRLAPPRWGDFERRARRGLAVVGAARAPRRLVMAETRVLKFEELPERRMPNGATIRQLVDKESCGARIKTNTVSFPAGHAVEFHRHNCNEVIVVFAGDCAVEIEGGAQTPLKPFDTVSVRGGQVASLPQPRRSPFTLLAIYDAERVERTLRDFGKTTID